MTVYVLLMCWHAFADDVATDCRIEGVYEMRRSAHARAGELCIGQLPCEASVEVFEFRVEP